MGGGICVATPGVPGNRFLRAADVSKSLTEVFQPDRANDEASLERLREFESDLFVVAAYGQILSADLLAIPRLGAINLHASLLPKYRGAAPIQYAMLNGETETGITIFQIEPKLDAGPVLGIVRLKIEPQETYGELQDRLAELAVPLTQRVIDDLEAGTTNPILQDSSLVTKAPRLKKSDGEIPWQKSATAVDCHIRAVQPWPKPSTTLESADGGALRLLVLEVKAPQEHVEGEPGTIRAADRRLFVRTGDGVLEILTVQPEGKRPMSAAEFLNGRTVKDGDRFTLPESPVATSI